MLPKVTDSKNVVGGGGQTHTCALMYKARQFRQHRAQTAQRKAAITDDMPLSVPGCLYVINDGLSALTE